MAGGGADHVVLAVCLTLLHSCQVVHSLHHQTILTNNALCEEFLNWIMSHPKCMRTVQRAVIRNCTNFPGVEKGDARTVSFNPDDFLMCLGAVGVASLLLCYSRRLKFHSPLQNSQGQIQSMRQFSKYNKHEISKVCLRERCSIFFSLTMSE